MGMTTTPTTGIAAKLAAIVSGATRWKWNAASGAVASPAMSEVSTSPVAERLSRASAPTLPRPSRLTRVSRQAVIASYPATKAMVAAKDIWKLAPARLSGAITRMTNAANETLRNVTAGRSSITAVSMIASIT